MEWVVSLKICYNIRIMKPTLVILAAGMGSRYGALKQVDSVGPSGEVILDYSIYDAVRGGFGKIVFVIRKDFEAEFKEKEKEFNKARAGMRGEFRKLQGKK